MSVLFVVPIIVDIHSHRFEVYTPVSEIHKNCRLSFRDQTCIQVRVSNKFKGMLLELFN